MICNVLAIAIDSYDDAKVKRLNNCQSDLTAITTILHSKYEINNFRLLVNREETTKSFIYNTIYDEITNSLDEDSLILVFLGHGEYNSKIGQSYWIPTDADILDQSTWIPVNEILSFLRQAELRHFCLIADNCYSGAIFEEADRGGGFQALEDRKSRHAITSGSIEKVKDGKPGESSPFNKVLCQLLEQSDSDYPVNLLGNQLIMAFPAEVAQTPRSGVITGVGDMGGCLVLKLKKEEQDGDLIRYKVTDLPLKVNQTINFSCDIVQFENNAVFDATVVNVAVQNYVYDVLGELRHDLNQGYLQDSTSEHLDFHIGCIVKMVTDKYVSLLISIQGYLGGAYPFNRLESINFAVESDRKISLNEFFYTTDEKQFFTDLINKYGESDQQKETLLEHVPYYEMNKMKFTLDQDSLSLYFIDYIPKMVQCYAFLDVPLADFGIDIGQVHEAVSE